MRPEGFFRGLTVSPELRAHRRTFLSSTEVPPIQPSQGPCGSTKFVFISRPPKQLRPDYRSQFH